MPTFIFRLWIVFLILSFLASSCSKNLAKRYRNTSNNIFNVVQPGNKTFVEVELKSYLLKDGPVSVPIYNVISLSPEGQAQYIKSLEGLAPAVGPIPGLGAMSTFIDRLTTNFSFNKDVKPNVKIIGKSVRKSLNFNVFRKYATVTPATPPALGSVTFNNMGDRIAYLELKVDLSPQSKAVFDSWDKFVTDYVTLNLGKVASAQQWNASLNLNAKSGAEISLTGNNSSEGTGSDKQGTAATIVSPLNGGTSTNVTSSELLNSTKTTGSTGNSAKTSAELGGSASLAFSDKFETSLDLTNRIMKLSGTLGESQLILRQESGQGIDLSGNTTVSLEYALTDDWASPVRLTKYKQLFGAGVPVPIDSLKNEYLTLIFPDIQNDVVGNLSFEFLYRQVNKGNRHLPEALHKVTFRYGQYPDPDPAVDPIAAYQNLVMIKKTDIRPKAYQLAIGANSLMVNGELVQFETTQEAANFYHYLGALLNRGPQPIAGIIIGGAGLTKVNYPGIVIKTVNL